MNEPYYDRHGVTVYAGDCLDVLRDIPDASVHAVICDPPYGLADVRPVQVVTALTAWASGDREHVPNGRGFMGRDWDAFVPPPAVWDECLRVLTPGGHLAAFAGSRTYDLMGLSIRMAGFEIRDGLQWLYGSGFPKSMDVSKAIDKQANAAPLWDAIRAHIREWRDHHGMKNADLNRAVGSSASGCGMARHWTSDAGGQHAIPSKAQWLNLKAALGWPDCELDEVYAAVRDGAERPVVGERTRKATGRMAQGEGGYAFGETFTDTAPGTPEAAQWSGWGTALKPAHEPIVLARKPLTGTVAATVLAHGTGALHVDACRVTSTDRLVRPAIPRTDNEVLGKGLGAGVQDEPSGRWPANVLLDEGAAAELDEQSAGTRASKPAKSGSAGKAGEIYNSPAGSAPVDRGDDPGGASRFFPVFRWEAKAPTSERPQVDGVAHPTVKPLAVMRWLVRLVTPPGGTVLDPFAGSGTTLHAARAEGFRAIGIEREPTYLPLIKARLDARPRAATGTQTATDNEPMDLLDLLTEDGAA